jgi:hypothetical protein
MVLASLTRLEAIGAKDDDRWWATVSGVTSATIAFLHLYG